MLMNFLIVQFGLLMVTRTGIRTPACARERQSLKVLCARYAKSLGLGGVLIHQTNQQNEKEHEKCSFSFW